MNQSDNKLSPVNIASLAGSKPTKVSKDPTDAIAQSDGIG